MAALDSLIDEGRSNGLTIQDRAAMNDTLNTVNQNEKSNRDAVLQNMQARGRGGSGFELASLLSGNQGSANRAATEGLDIASESRTRALNDLMEAGQLGGQIQNQDFNQQAQIAKAKDLINQFNATNSQAVANRNVNRSNDAQQFNLNNSQRIADTNVTNRNQAQTHNKGLYQQDFNNRMNKAGSVADQYNRMAGDSYGEAQRVSNEFQNMGQGVGAVGTSLKLRRGQSGQADGGYQTPMSQGSSSSSTYDPSEFEQFKAYQRMKKGQGGY